MAIGDQWRAGQSRHGRGASGASAALAANHCGRSQPALSKKCAPSATSRSYSGVRRSGRACSLCWRGWVMS
jgi:hypothetical protein